MFFSSMLLLLPSQQPNLTKQAYSLAIENKDARCYRHSCLLLETGERSTDDPTAVTRSGQSIFMSVYRTKIADQCRLIIVTWCKNSLLRGLTVSLQGPNGENHYNCKVELKPWYFWRMQGCKRFLVDGKSVDIFGDLKSAKFYGETKPDSEYYVAVVCDEEVVLLVGDLKKDAYRRTGCRPSLIDPMLVSRREHIFGKKRFTTRAKLYEKGRLHETSIECKNRHPVNPSESNGGETEMEIRVDGQQLIHVRHLQWKFRGSECIYINKLKVEVYRDVHDWLFSPGLRHALFTFKPVQARFKSQRGKKISKYDFFGCFRKKIVF